MTTVAQTTCCRTHPRRSWLTALLKRTPPAVPLEPCTEAYHATTAAWMPNASDPSLKWCPRCGTEQPALEPLAA